ncbi:MAG: hypothetical protein JWR77_271 [Rhizorhabdus sp.]|nr:hypothetical protein [Rhizorhabdus sp.]
MAISWDTEYFKRRAEQSRLAAANGTSNEAAIVHGELTAAYDVLARNAANDKASVATPSEGGCNPSRSTLERWANEGGTLPA